MNKIGLLIGCEDLPKIVIAELKRQNKEFFIISLVSKPNIDLNQYDHEVIPVTKIGKIIASLKKHQITEVLFLGKIARPSFSKIIPDLKGLRLFFRIIRNMSFSDHKLFTELVKFAESNKLKILGVKDISKEILAPKGLITNKKPDKNFLKDVDYGQEIFKKISHADIGQSIIVENNLVIGVEAVEGTDELIKRCAKYFKEKGGVLLKFKKPHQDDRVDLPVIGIKTMRNLLKGNFRGVVIEAGNTIIIDYEDVVDFANENNLVILSI